jgi:hypothetical protein
MRQWEDHGDPSVDARWRRAIMRGRDAIQRHASLAGAPLPRMCPDGADGGFMPVEFANAQTIPESYFICEDILAATP